MSNTITYPGPIGEPIEQSLPCDNDQVSDGHHSFSDLYQHRHHLLLAIVQDNPSLAWFSPFHHDGSSFNGSFIVGLSLPSGDISYHLPTEYLPLIKITGAKFLERAPPFDGHTPEDVVNRLHQWILKRSRR